MTRLLFSLPQTGEGRGGGFDGRTGFNETSIGV